MWESMGRERWVQRGSVVISEKRSAGSALCLAPFAGAVRKGEWRKEVEDEERGNGGGFRN